MNVVKKPLDVFLIFQLGLFLVYSVLFIACIYNPVLMSDTPTVVFALTGDVRMNSRAVKQFRSILEMGYRIKAFTLGPPDSGHPFGENFKLHVLPTPKGSGMHFFRQVHQLFSKEVVHVKADIYHASDLYVLPAMAKAAQNNKAKLVFDSRELYPYVAATSKRPWITLFWHMLSWRYIPQADVVFTVSKSIAERLTMFYDIPEPAVLYNVPIFRPDVVANDALRRIANVSTDKVVILHQGNMQKSRGCGLLIQAMQEVENAVLVFLGNGPLRYSLQNLVIGLGLDDKVRFLSPVPPDQLLEMTAGADFGVTLLEDTCLNHRFALPNKLFEYLMVGLPVMASKLPEIEKVVEGYQVGLTVDPEDHPALVATLQRMVNDVASRKQWREHSSAVFEEYNWESASKILQQAYQKLLRP
ncbi:MAG TPA: glycosyl transferase family 1 [Bacteroidetes bacterium]|nr:glycosyl transferase family 1 [Bacteroidota bacterium]